MYASAEEFQQLIKEVLSWDIRSLSQQERPHPVPLEKSNGLALSDKEYSGGHSSSQDVNGEASSQSLNGVTYHLVLEGVDISYKIDGCSNIVVEKAALVSDTKFYKNDRIGHLKWRDKLDM